LFLQLVFSWYLKPQVPMKFSSERVYRERKEENSS
jgi:hypothetical protein